MSVDGGPADLDFGVASGPVRPCKSLSHTATFDGSADRDRDRTCRGHRFRGRRRLSRTTSATRISRPSMRRQGISTPPIVKLLNSTSRLGIEAATPLRLRRNSICGVFPQAFRGAAGQNGSLGAGIQDQSERGAIGHHRDEREAVHAFQRDPVARNRAAGASVRPGRSLSRGKNKPVPSKKAVIPCTREFPLSAPALSELYIIDRDLGEVSLRGKQGDRRTRTASSAAEQPISAAVQGIAETHYRASSGSYEIALCNTIAAILEAFTPTAPRTWRPGLGRLL